MCKMVSDVYHHRLKWDWYIYIYLIVTRNERKTDANMILQLMCRTINTAENMEKAEQVHCNIIMNSWKFMTESTRDKTFFSHFGKGSVSYQ